MITALLLGVGLAVGVSLVELLPTAAIEAVVIAGLFVVATLPADEAGGRRDDGSDPRPEPVPPPRGGGAPAWLSLLERDAAELAAEDVPPRAGERVMPAR